MGLTRGWFLGTPELGYGMGHRRCLRRASREHQRQKGEKQEEGSRRPGEEVGLEGLSTERGFHPKCTEGSHGRLFCKPGTW